MVLRLISQINSNLNQGALIQIRANKLF